MRDNINDWGVKIGDRMICTVSDTGINDYTKGSVYEVLEVYEYEGTTKQLVLSTNFSARYNRGFGAYDIQFEKIESTVLDAIYGVENE